MELCEEPEEAALDDEEEEDEELVELVVLDRRRAPKWLCSCGGVSSTSTGTMPFCHD
jgi:hypothetical protein